MRGCSSLFGMLPSAANFVQPKLDTTVFIFALAISLATGLLFGVIPALRASRASVAETLKEEARTTGRSRSRVTVGNVLLVGQVAFSFLLLVTAALFLRSIQRAYAIDPGFQTAHLAIFMTNPGQAGIQKATNESVLQRCPRARGTDSGCRVRIVGVEYSALGANGEWTGGGRPSTTVASRQTDDDR